MPDLRFLLDQVVAGRVGDPAEHVDGDRVGLVGWRFGGWAALATPEVDDRVGAVVALAPAGNSKPLPGIIPATLTFAWRREVATLYLVAEQDRFTPLPGQRELLARTPSRARMFVLGGADHGHFGDVIDEPGACPADHAHVFARGLSLAHLDAALTDDDRARRLLGADPAVALGKRGGRPGDDS